MSRKLTQEEFIERAEKVHIDENGNTKYDYSLVEYINNNTKVKIICLKHGVFEQIPSSHLIGKCGCEKCSNEAKSLSHTGTTEKFIEKATQIHGDKYDYSKVIYVKAKEKVIIICEVCRLENGCGEFLQSPDSHLNEKGCPTCANNQISTTEKFIEKAKLLHINEKTNLPKYDYSLVNYIDAITKVKILCPTHGEFEQTPSNHIHAKCGCPHCKESKGEKKVKKFLEENNIILIRQHKFNDCKNINQLPFDFYLPEHNLCIEYDGELHYNPKKYFGGEAGLKETQKRDQIKTNYCLNNNINLLRIPYWDFKNINEILQKELLLVS